MTKANLGSEWLRSKRGEKWHKNFRVNECYVGPDVPPLLCDELEKLAYDEQIRRPCGKRKKISDAQRREIETFLERHRNVDQNHCLLFPNAAAGVRARVYLNGIGMDAARAMCTLAHGAPISSEMVARHLCGNGHLSCVNPQHLRWGTPEENSRDRELHRFRPNFMPDLSIEQIDAIKSDRRLANIVAIDHQIHSIVVRIIRGDTVSWP